MKKLSYILLPIIFIITIILGYNASKLKFDYNLDNFFPKSDTELDFFKQYKKDFTSDDDFLIIGIENNNKSIFNKEFLNRLDSITKQLKKNKYIESVHSLSTATNPIITPFGIKKEKYINLSSENYKEDSINIFQSQNIVNNFISNDSKNICIQVNVKPRIIKPYSDTLLNQINTILKINKLGKIHIAGKIRAQKVYIEQMQNEMVVFTSLSLILLVILLYFAFKTWWGIIIPITVIAFSIIWTLGIYSLLGQHIDVLTVILPSIMFVVGMSDIVHFSTKYLDEIRLGFTKEEAITKTLKEVGFATFLTAFTTAIGFATLATANITPIQNFGIFTAIGVFIAYCLSFTLLPSILIHLKIPNVNSNKIVFWDRKLHSLLLIILKNKKTIVISFCTILIISIGFITKIKTNTKILDDISENDPLMQDFTFFENHFGGVRGFEAQIKVKNKQLLDLNTLKEIEKTERYLNDEYQVKNIISIVSIVKAINKAANNGENQYYRLPINEQELSSINKIITKLKKREEFKHYINLDKNIARISGRVLDLGSAEMRIKNEKFYNFINTSKNNNITYKITGTAHLVNLNNDYITNDMSQGITLDLIVIFTIVLLMFRSIKMGLIVVATNFIPLIIVGAIMGIFGIDLKVSTSIVFSIAFGIAVDDTIHFISKFKYELQSKTMLYALKRTYISTGKAIIVTSLLLVGGFGTLMFSNFKGTFYLGLLVSLTLFIAIIADLLLLPILVTMFYKKK
ncbi:MAG: hypothetical protein RLZZ175_1649 [Bacteroidota bacterium]|jgi:hydrophobe/amphiphile efflux-3 (HAE3) family protein